MISAYARFVLDFILFLCIITNFMIVLEFELAYILTSQNGSFLIMELNIPHKPKSVCLDR